MFSIMRSKRFVTISMAAILSVLICSLPAAASEETPVSGKVFLVPKSTNVYVTLSGRGALDLYNAMTAKARNDACREGRKIKWSGNLYCSLAKDGKSADCSFGLNHKTGKSSPGQPC